MTDRSSDERSRFEKELARFATWAGPRGYNLLMWGDEYSDDKTDDAFSIWRAALEDRQEAAPLHRVVIDNPLAQFTELSLEMCMHSQGGDFPDRMRCFPSAKFHMWCDLGRMLQNRGVPSEATPSKENAPHKICQCLPCRAWRDFGLTCGAGDYSCVTCGIGMEEPCEHWRNSMAAPAPEVQGTPTKSKTTPLVTHKPWCASVPRPMDRPMGRGPYKCSCGAVEAAPSPVGTPQKETPPKFTNRRGKPCSQACYEGRHAECTETLATCNCTFRGSHTTVHAYATFPEMAASIPERVQGKEPQVWRPQVEPIRREMMKRFSDTLSMEEIASCAYAISTANYSEGAPPMKTFGEFWETVTDSEIEDGIEDVAKRAYLSGEAAGRRSAIMTVEQVEKMREGCHATYNGGHHDAVPYEAFHHGMDTVFNVLKARAERECAELLEKTK